VRCKIVEDHAVTEAIGRAYEVFERTDDAMGAISFALERDPKSAGFESEEAPGTYWLFRPGKPSIKFPAVTVVYTLTHETVWLRSVRLEHDGVIFHSAAFEKARNAS
jgi:hypothetical protein